MEAKNVKYSKIYWPYGFKSNNNEKDVEKLCKTLEYKFYSVCVNGCYVKKCKDLLKGSGVDVGTL